MTKLTIEEVMKNRIILRDKRADLKEAFDEKDKPLKDAEIQCESWLLRRAIENGVDKFAVAGIGTAFKQTRTSARCADWGLFSKWVLKTKNIDAVEARVSSSFLKEYREEKNKLPPGVSVFEEDRMVVRRDSHFNGGK